MAGVLCRLSEGAQRAVNQLLEGSSPDEAAIFLKCHVAKGELDVDFTLEETDISEISSELSDTLPALILFRTKLTIDEQAQASSVLLINFNPMNTPLTLKGTYKNTFQDLQRQLVHKVKALELNDLGDFRQEIIEARARGLTGTMAEAAPPMKQTFGREAV